MYTQLINMEEVKIPPPVPSAATIGELATHFSYVRRDVDEVKAITKVIVEKLDIMKENYVTRMDFDKHLEGDEDHETRLRTIEDTKIPDVRSDIDRVMTQMKTWGTVGALILGGLQVIEIVYSLTHFK